MRAKASIILASILPLALSAACSSQLGGSGPEGDYNPPSDPGNPDPDATARIAGNYEVRSQLSLRDATDGLAGVLGNLDELADDPAGTIADILLSDGNDILDSIPGFLKDAFFNEVNNFILSNPQTAAQLRETSVMIFEMVQSFEAVSLLQVDSADAAGSASATHQLQAINFSINRIPREILATNANLSENISINASYADGTVDIGSHELSLPVGALANEALEVTLQGQGQTSISGLLSTLIDCEGAAAQVGDITLDTFTLVSESQIESLCGQALNLAGAQIEAKLSELSIDMTVVGGQGALQMSGADVNVITGNWDFAFGSQNLPSSFEATRK